MILNSGTFKFECAQHVRQQFCEVESFKKLESPSIFNLLIKSGHFLYSLDSNLFIHVLINFSSVRLSNHWCISSFKF